MQRIILFLFCFVTVNAAVATTKIYHADLFDSQWSFHKDGITCNLSHKIPNYGTARFFYQAGTSLKFDLTVSDKSLRRSSAFLSSIPPEWKSRLRSVEIGRVLVVEGNTPVTLEQEDSMNILSELELGMMPEMEYRDWYNNQYRVKVILSPVNFMEQLPAFKNCMLEFEQEFPLGFEDLRFANVFFDSDSIDISTEYHQRLTEMAKYAAKDPTIEKVVVTGYADASGDPCYNRDISNFRAENVMDILEDNGISNDKIEVIAKGASNKDNPNPEGFAFDRRVTVELIRKGEYRKNNDITPRTEARPDNNSPFVDEESDF